MTVYGFIRENRGKYGVKRPFGGKPRGLLQVGRARRLPQAKGLGRKAAGTNPRCSGQAQGALRKPQGELSREHGVNAGGKRVARLMRENGLGARRPSRCPRTADSAHGMAVCRNTLDRDFKAQKPGSK